MLGFFKKNKNLVPFAMKMPQIQENLALVQGALEQWLGFRRYLAKAFSEEAITPEEESGFLEVKSQIARAMRSVAERIKEKEFYTGGDKAAVLLKQCVSVGHMRSLTPPDRRTLLKDWHGIFIQLSRSVGVFKFLSEGYVPPPRKKMAASGAPGGGTTLAGIKGAGASKKK
ncbi:MAG: hypothetical protein SF028_10890 [Candidatus Sumerlaeia bacterium]|nr:hypothetical protein [Candidatus Sumerlaeia bacterium]